MNATTIELIEIKDKEEENSGGTSNEDKEIIDAKEGPANNTTNTSKVTIEQEALINPPAT